MNSRKRITSSVEFDPSLTYQVRLKGHLDVAWTDWLGDLTITLTENGETILTSPTLDQATLHGLLKKVRDAGLTLISVRPVEETEKE